MEAATIEAGRYLPTLLVGLIGWLLSRAIKSVDEKLARLESKVDLLTAADGDHTSKLVELAVRVAQVEIRQEREAMDDDDD